MSDNLEFHYVVSYREGYGWQTVPDTEQAVMPNGTIYDWNENKWVVSWTDSEDPEEAALDTLDTEHYRMLNSALRQMNGEI